MMMIRIILLVFVASVADAVPGNSKILNGNVATQAEFPYMASLKNSSGYPVCGGAILNNRWILSAAHCTFPYGPTVLAKVGVGSVELRNQINYPIQFTVPHPDYEQSTRLSNILLVKVASKISFTPNVVSQISINTNSNDDLKLISSMSIAGWGLYNPLVRNNLTTVTYFTQKQTDCWTKNNEAVSRLPYSPETQLCAGSSSSTELDPSGICCGDIGSPLVYNGLIYGVSSRLMSTQCASTYPDVFTRVSYFSPWIYGVINGNL